MAVKRTDHYQVHRSVDVENAIGQPGDVAPKNYEWKMGSYFTCKLRNQGSRKYIFVKTLPMNDNGVGLDVETLEAMAAVILEAADVLREER